MKKTNLTNKIMPCMATALIMASSVLGATPVMAESNAGWDGTINGSGEYETGVGGTSTEDDDTVTTVSFDKTISMDAEANVPNAGYTYTVSAGEATDDIFAGVDADKVVVSDSTLTFTTSDETQADDTDTTKKSATKSVSLDFSACTFAEPGVYRYVITEAGDNQGITNDENSQRIVDVYVNGNESQGTSPSIFCQGCAQKFDTVEDAEQHINANVTDACLFYTFRPGSAGTWSTYIAAINVYDGTTKSDGYTGDYDTSNVTFRKEVSGNQASPNTYFEFTVSITDAVAGTVYDVDLSNADATVDEYTNPSQLTVGEDGTVTQTFYLKHGQEITINGIAKDSVYDITEDADSYESTAAGVDGYTDATSDTIVSSDVKTSYLNTKEGVIPTGIIMSVAPFAAVTLFGGAGIVTFAMKRKKDNDEE